MLVNTAIVTGANGWLGKSLCAFLLNGHDDNEKLKNIKYKKLVAICYPGDDTEKLKKISDKIEIVYADISSKLTLTNIFNELDESFDLFHTAGIIHPKKSKDFIEVNFLGTKNLLEIACNKNINKTVIISSNSPIGCNPFPEHRFDEDSPYNPYMGYGQSKMLMEKFVKDFASENDLSITLIRCPWFYGPNQPPRQTLFFQMIKNGKMPIVGPGNNMRSMSYVDNLCQGIMLSILKKNKGADVFWIADERPYSMNEIVDTVEDVLEKDFNFKVKGKRLKLPWFVSELAMIIDWTLQKIGLYHQKFHVLSEMNKNISCSIDKAKDELGYEPKVVLRDGMKKSIQWCLDNNYKI